MSTELIAILGVGITIVGVGVTIVGVILNGQRSQRADIKDLRKETQAEFKATREEIGGLRERMAHLEGLIESLREAITGRRVAEGPGQYSTD